MNKNIKKILILFFSFALLNNFYNYQAKAIEEEKQQTKIQKLNSSIKNKCSFFKIKNKKENIENNEKIKLTTEQKAAKKAKKLFTSKKSRVNEINLPKVIQGRPEIPFEQIPVMSIEECVNYAIEHNPNLFASKNRISAVKSTVNQAKGNYAPKLTAKVNYNYNSTQTQNTNSSHNNSIGFNAGISEMIWDFGKTTANINMAKYNLLSTQYDYDFDILGVIYDVKINYYKVLSALASLEVYEQYVRIQQLNYERTKSMFNEGLKSKIDVVNAQVNLTDAKIQLIEGQNELEIAINDLKKSMFYQEEKPFVVKNTENFNFLKADYRKKIESIVTIKPQEAGFKRTPDGLITLTSGIEHNDIIQDFKFEPLVLSKQEAVNQALELRPDLKSSQMLILVQKESLEALKKQYAPEINGELTWSYTKNEHSYISPLQLSAGAGLGSINPYKIHYQIKEGENYLDIALHNYNIAKSDIYWNVQANYINMRQLERKIPLLNSKVKATLENFELADGRYSVGLNNYIELQNALINYNTAQLNFVDAVFKYNVSRETLLKSMGVR